VVRRGAAPLETSSIQCREQPPRQHDLALSGGLCNREVALRTGCTPQWVRKIIHRFNRGGIEAIIWYPAYCNQQGPSKFFADIVEQIVEVALSSPRQLLGMSVWSLATLRDYLVEQKIIASISLERLRQLLRSRKIRWQHTKTWK